MKKLGFCPNCNLEFEYNINNMNDFNNVFCPKCNSRVSNNYSRPKQMTKADRVAGSIFSKLITFYFYFYLIMSSIGLVCYILDFMTPFKIFTTISLILYVVELFLGYTRNVFGLTGMIISIVICSLKLNDIKMGIYLGSCIMFIISGLLRLLFWFLIYRLDRRLTKH